MVEPGSPSRPAPHTPDVASDPPDVAYAIARELHGILPFGARADALTRCPRLADRVGRAAGPDEGPDRGAGPDERTAAAVVSAIESFTDPVDLPDHHPGPLPPDLVRRMLHVLLATRDLGWPGTDAPLSVRRVAAADLFFDSTQTVLSDHDWKGPEGAEFALLTVLAERVCRRTPPHVAPAADGGDGDRDAGEMLGKLHRVRRPRGL